MTEDYEYANIMRISLNQQHQVWKAWDAGQCRHYLKKMTSLACIFYSSAMYFKFTCERSLSLANWWAQNKKPSPPVGLGQVNANDTTFFY